MFLFYSCLYHIFQNQLFFFYLVICLAFTQFFPYDLQVATLTIAAGAQLIKAQTTECKKNWSRTLWGPPTVPACLVKQINIHQHCCTYTSTHTHTLTLFLTISLSIYLSLYLSPKKDKKKKSIKKEDTVYKDQSSTVVNNKKIKKKEAELSASRQADTKLAAAKGQKPSVFFSLGKKRKGISAQC